MNPIVSIHVAATLFMTGLIWFVQVVHYPLMSRVGERRFEDYERRHQRRTSWVVGPVMLVELATGVWVAAWPGAGSGVGVGSWAAIAGLGMLGAIWVSTMALQVPLHRRLESGYDEAAARRLVSTNWIRTVLWTGRSVMWLFVVSSGEGAGP